MPPAMAAPPPPPMSIGRPPSPAFGAAPAAPAAPAAVGKMISLSSSPVADRSAGVAPPRPMREPVDPTLAILEEQAASGLWEGSGTATTTATVSALVRLLRLGLTTTHPVHGAQIKKATGALALHLRGAVGRGVDVRLVELGLAVAWVLATGRRTRLEIEEAARAEGVAAPVDERAARARVDALATALGL